MRVTLETDPAKVPVHWVGALMLLGTTLSGYLTQFHVGGPFTSLRITLEVNGIPFTIKLEKE